MNDIQFTIIDERLKSIERLLINIQPKKKLKQTKIIDERSLEDQLQDYRNKYAPSLITDFLLYWEEGERWKKQKVFDISKRLERWKRTEEKWEQIKSQKQIKVEEKPQNKENRQNIGFSKLFD